MRILVTAVSDGSLLWASSSAIEKGPSFFLKKKNIIDERESPEEMNDTQMDREIGLMISPRVIRSHSKFVQWRGIFDTSQIYGSKVGQTFKRFQHPETEILSQFSI